MKILLSAIILIVATVQYKPAQAGMYCNVQLSSECNREGCGQLPTRNASISINLTKGIYKSCSSLSDSCVSSEILDASFTREYTSIRSTNGAELKIAREPNHMTYLDSGEFIEYREHTFSVITRYGKCSEG